MISNNGFHPDISCWPFGLPSPHPLRPKCIGSYTRYVKYDGKLMEVVMKFFTVDECHKPKIEVVIGLKKKRCGKVSSMFRTKGAPDWPRRFRRWLHFIGVDEGFVQVLATIMVTMYQSFLNN